MSKERPQIKGIIREDTKELELFQNEVLRPIIKSKHLLILEVFKSISKKRKKNLMEMTEMEKETHIKISCKRDLEFRNQIIGLILGNFDMEEYERYLLAESEYKRRILQIIKKRLLDSISEIT